MNVTTLHDLPDPATVAIERRVAISDTDASGWCHYAAVTRWVDDLEQRMHIMLGIDHTRPGPV